MQTDKKTFAKMLVNLLHDCRIGYPSQNRAELIHAEVLCILPSGGAGPNEVSALQYCHVTISVGEVCGWCVVQWNGVRDVDIHEALAFDVRVCEYPTHRLLTLDDASDREKYRFRNVDRDIVQLRKVIFRTHNHNKFEYNWCKSCVIVNCYIAK